MKTPIFDFVKDYIQKETLRFHMPGHKGKGELSCEAFDITEIKGADSLFEAEGIIEESEKNASFLFGTRKTLYSAEGSSLCIRAMLCLAMQYAEENGLNKSVLAGRNAHKTFLSAAALLDFEIEWLYSEEDYLSLKICPETLEKKLSRVKPAAVYITCPDYLGNLNDISEISRLCKKHGTLLLVDNAHGAYLKFLRKSLHPMDQGADLCCDSAHKTLPVLTGGAYLHIGKNAPEFMADNAKNVMSLFASTSPSYLIMQSLDLANRYISEGFKEKLDAFLIKVELAKQKLLEKGYTLCGDEPLKLTINAKKYGYFGTELAEILRENNMECEFSDPDFLVLMLTPEQDTELEKLTDALLLIEKKEEISEKPPVLTKKEQVLSVREAMLDLSEQICVKDSVGRILASASVGCPPAVPILVSGEKIDQNAVDAFSYYGIDKCFVVKTKESK